MGYRVIIFDMLGGYIIRATMGFLNTKDVMSFKCVQEILLPEFVGTIAIGFKISPFDIPRAYLNVSKQVPHILKTISQSKMSKKKSIPQFTK